MEAQAVSLCLLHLRRSDARQTHDAVRASPWCDASTATYTRTAPHTLPCPRVSPTCQESPVG